MLLFFNVVGGFEAIFFGHNRDKSLNKKRRLIV